MINNNQELIEIKQKQFNIYNNSIKELIEVNSSEYIKKMKKHFEILYKQLEKIYE